MAPISNDVVSAYDTPADLEIGEDGSMYANVDINDLFPGEVVSTSKKEKSIYVVRPGDTISEIAERFGVSPNTIRWQNDIGEKEYIRAGQELEILPVSGIEIKVQKGDTLSGIAKKYDSSVSDIKEQNDVEESSLQIGQTLLIPGGKPIVSQTKPKETISSPAKKEYISSPKPSGGKRLTSGQLGDWIWPVDGGVVTQGYGYTSFASRSGFYKNNFHGGVDIGAPKGTSILAAKDGIVSISKTGYNGGYGNYIEISHFDGTKTRYGHNDSNLVKAGERVTQGQVIARMGRTGRATGDHLHFEIRNSAGTHLESNPFYQAYRNY